MKKESVILSICFFLLVTNSFLFAQDWICYSVENSPLPSEGIYGIKVENSSKFWIGTYGYGIFCYDHGNWVNYNSQNTGYLIDNALTIEIDNDNNKWFGTVFQGGDGNGLFKFDGNTWTEYNTTNSNISGNGITYLSLDDDGLLWIGNENGISTFDGQNWNNFSLDSEFKHITAIAFENNETYWFGTNVINENGNHIGGLYKFNPITSDFEKYNTDNSELPDNFVFGIDFDESGNKWLATLGGGAASFDGDTNWEIYDTTNSDIASNEVFDTFVDEEDNIWFATSGYISGGGVSYYNGFTWTTYDTTNCELTSNDIKQIEIDENCHKYFTTGNGVCIFSGETNVEDDYILPISFEMYQNYPNPFNPTTTISFSIPEESKVKLLIYNINGQKVKTLTNKKFIQGNYSIVWNGDDESGKKISSGIYLYNLKVNGKSKAVKKCLFLK